MPGSHTLHKVDEHTLNIHLNISNRHTHIQTRPHDWAYNKSISEEEVIHLSIYQAQKLGKTTQYTRASLKCLDILRLIEQRRASGLGLTPG